MTQLKANRIIILQTLCIILSVVGCDKKPVIRFSEDIEWSYIDKSIVSLFINPNGIIYAGGGSGELYRSTDDGTTWETIYTIENGKGPIRCVFISRGGAIFVSRDKSGELKRSGDQGTTFETCLNLSNKAASVVWRMAENRKGWLYAAEYSNEDMEERCAYIYRSKNDGKDWETVYHDPKARHFHFVAVDPYTDYIYAAAGDGAMKAVLVRSVDDGDSWVTLGNKGMNPEINWQFTSVTFTAKYRIFGEDEPPQSDIVRTVDDIHFEKVFVPDGPEKHNFWAWGRIDKKGNILFGSWTQHAALRKSRKGVPAKANGVIYLSRDEGTTWKKVVDFGLRKGHSGTHFASNVKDGTWIYCHIRDVDDDARGLKIRVK